MKEKKRKGCIYRSWHVRLSHSSSSRHQPQFHAIPTPLHSTPFSLHSFFHYITPTPTYIHKTHKVHNITIHSRPFIITIQESQQNTSSSYRYRDFVRTCEVKCYVGSLRWERECVCECTNSAISMCIHWCMWIHLLKKSVKNHDGRDCWHHTRVHM